MRQTWFAILQEWISLDNAYELITVSQKYIGLRGSCDVVWVRRLLVQFFGILGNCAMIFLSRERHDQGAQCFHSLTRLVDTKVFSNGIAAFRLCDESF